MQPLYVRFKGLNENVTYKDVKTGKIYPAEALMNIGMPFMPELGEYQSWQVELKRCQCSVMELGQVLPASALNDYIQK